MDFKLELVLIPVTDVDRAKAFYVEKCGFTLDVDHQPNDEFRVVQMTPPGSACSITIGKGVTDASPGLLPRDPSRGHRHRGCARRAPRARRGGQRHPAYDAGWMEGRHGSAAQRLQLVRRLQRPRWQHLGAAGGQAWRAW